MLFRSCRQTTKLDIGSGVHLELLSSGELVKRVSGIAFTALRTRLFSTIALVEARINNGTEQAVFGVGAGIENNGEAGAGSESVRVAGITLCIVCFCPNVTAYAQAGVGAGDVEETRTIGRADFDVLNPDSDLVH